MPTQLTDPIVKVAAEYATLDKLTINVVRQADFSIDTNQSTLSVELNLRDGLNKVIETRTLSRPIADLPNALKADLRAVWIRLLGALRSAALLPPGTDTDDV